MSFIGAIKDAFYALENPENAQLILSTITL